MIEPKRLSQNIYIVRKTFTFSAKTLRLSQNQTCKCFRSDAFRKSFTSFAKQKAANVSGGML